MVSEYASFFPYRNQYKKNVQVKESLVKRIEEADKTVFEKVYHFSESASIEEFGPIIEEILDKITKHIKPESDNIQIGLHNNLEIALKRDSTLIYHVKDGEWDKAEISQLPNILHKYGNIFSSMEYRKCMKLIAKRLFGLYVKLHNDELRAKWVADNKW